MKPILKLMIVMVLGITLPVTQAYAVIQDPHSTLSDILESGQDSDSEALNMEVDVTESQIPQPDFYQASALIAGSSAEEEIEIQEEFADDSDDLASLPVVGDEKHPFWTKKKIVIGTTILITTALLLLLLLGGSHGGSDAGAGSGSGGFGTVTDAILGGGGSGGGGGGTIPTNPPVTPKHNPEPSTFLLLGLGLLVPYLRKRNS